MKNIKLLWIDDVGAWARSACDNLKIIAKKKGIELNVLFAENGEDINQKLMMHEFDGILMDYHMEPFLGTKYIADIREHEHNDGIRIIFYSQDNSTNIGSLVAQYKNIVSVYRPNLEDKIRDIYFE